MRKRWITLILLVLGMVVGGMPSLALEEAAEDGGNVLVFSDMPNNWSTAALNNAVTNGLITGTDGKIMPNDYLTRAQMGAVMVRAFGATDKGDVSGFVDISSTDWFVDDMAKASQMGLVNGDGNVMRPNDYISRQELFVIMGRALCLEPEDLLEKSFADGDDISHWAKGYVNAVVNAGYVSGSNGRLNPDAFVARAEFAQILDNVFAQHIKSGGSIPLFS